MPNSPHTRRPDRHLAAGLLLLAAGLSAGLSGCASEASGPAELTTDPAARTTALTLGDFRNSTYIPAPSTPAASAPDTATPPSLATGPLSRPSKRVAATNAGTPSQNPALDNVSVLEGPTPAASARPAAAASAPATPQSPTTTPSTPNPTPSAASAPVPSASTPIAPSGRVVGQSPNLANAPAVPSASSTTANPTPPPTPLPPRPNPSMSAVSIEGDPNIVMRAGPPPAPSDGAVPIGGAVTIEAMVGQVNGKPIYSSKVLGTLDEKLAADAVKLSDDRKRWIASAGSDILSNLKPQMEQELLLAEARSILSPDERKGLIFFLTTLRQNLVSELGGSQEAANARLSEREEGSLDLKVSNQRDLALLQLIYQRYIIPRVNVSWRDVQLQYERDHDRFHHPAVAKFTMVWVSRTNSLQVERVTSELQKGTPLAELAADRRLNEYMSDGKPGFEKIVGDGGLEKTSIIAFAPINAAAQKLHPGEIAGPIEFKAGGDPTVAWIRLDELAPPTDQSLDDVQLMLYRELRQRRLEAEVNRYFLRLKDRGAKTDEDELAARLVTIAAQRYFDRRTADTIPPANDAPPAAPLGTSIATPAAPGK
ncbi:hypothetical protein BH11PLA1_BH11PLA1_18610 [soil metagenome]